MCGISGFNWEDEGKIKTMVSCLSHRGPDADAVFIDNDISLGHNRLSIIDLSASANQPMFDNEKELVVVLNGEIYNFLDLKKELESEYSFKTRSDTEVILAGYRKWGKGVVEHLNGMFAFAIWDRRSRELFCARDHAGIKPFYYSWNEGRLIFASETKAILTHNVPRKLNLKAFNHYLRILYVPEPMTMIEGIYKLAPSHTLTLKNGLLSVEVYGQRNMKKTNLSYREAVSILREKVIKAVQRHLVADVPVGVYLSGGIDSSTVLFSMSRFHERIKTFSIGFDLPERGEKEKFNHDFELAGRTANFFGTEHHPIIVSAKDVLDSFEKLSIQNDDPVSNPTAVPMMLLAKFARKEVAVALTGSGGDEFFGGYERYRMALAASYYKKLPSLIRQAGNYNSTLSKLNYKSDVALFAQFMFEKDTKLSSIIRQSAFEKDIYVKEYFNDRYLAGCAGDPAECFMMVDQESWLPVYFFSLSDRMSMLSALEERVPLVDKELVAFSRSLPRSFKVDLFRTKKILKDAFRDDLPDFLFRQPKRGWFSPGAKWLRDPDFSRMVQEILSGDYYVGSKSLFNWSQVQEMLERHIRKEEYNLTILWAILTFQIWARRYQIEI